MRTPEEVSQAASHGVTFGEMVRNDHAPRPRTMGDPVPPPPPPPPPPPTPREPEG